MSAASDMASAATFAFAGCRIQLDPLPAADLQWLGEFLTPPFALSGAAPGAAGYRVTPIVDAARYRRLLAAGPDGGAVDAFVLDRGIVRLPTWRHDGKGLVAFDESTLVLYQVDGTHISVLSEVERPAVRVAVMRAIREVASVHAIRSGAFLLHAAAFVLDGRAVIVAGAKGAGKTTLLLQALDGGRAAYLGNDRVLVSEGADGTLARGVPTIVSIRASTLPLLPRLAERLDRRPYHFRSTVAEVHRGVPLGRPAGPRRTLTTAQLCELTGARALADAAPALVLFPERDRERDVPGLTALGPDLARECLGASLFGSAHPGRHSALFGGPHEPADAATPTRRTLPLLGAARCYRMRPATGACHAEGNLDAIIEHLD